MFSLYQKINDVLEIEGEEYQINASFDVILKVIELFEEEKISEKHKLNIALKLLFGPDSEILKYELVRKVEIYNNIFEKYIKDDQSVKPVRYDRLGNVMPEPKDDSKPNYSLRYDASYIYASFLQAYGMDLHNQCGILHWFKFKALLEGLPEGTKFRQVVSIRMWKPASPDDNYEREMRELQQLYALPGQEFDEEEDY